MTYDASNRKDIRRAEKVYERLERERIDYLRVSLSTPGGRSFFYNILENCHLFSDPFTGDALKEAYLKGERNIGLRLFSDIVVYCPDQYLLMMKESNVRDAAAERSSLKDDGRDNLKPDLDSNDGAED